MKCSRTACDNAAHPLLKHDQTGAVYCAPCARKINAANPGLIPWPSNEVIMEHKSVERHFDGTPVTQKEWDDL